MIRLTFSSTNPPYTNEVEIEDDKHFERVISLWNHLKDMIRGIIKK